MAMKRKFDDAGDVANKVDALVFSALTAFIDPV